MASTSISGRKGASKKSVSKKATPKKTSSKKSVAKKVTPKKAAAKTTVTKKSVTKKAAVKKTVTNKTTIKKTAPKKTAPKKTAPKKAVAKKTVTKKAAPKKAPTKKVKPPAFLTDKKWLKQQRDELIEERAMYTHNAESLAAEAAALMADRDPGDVQFDEESGEGDTIAVERDRDLALSAKAREKVDEIDAALVRMDKGLYGHCVSRDEGDFIPKDRLEALPMAAKCVTHQTAMF